MVKAIRTSALILLLTCSTQAGIMQNEAPAPPPQPQPASAVQETTDTSQETSADGYIQNDAPSDLTQVVLEVLAVLPSLF